MKDPNPPKKVNTCAFCDPGITHIINPINYPNDMYAYPDNLGRWKCGNCIDKELQDRIIKVTPNSQPAKEVIAERKSKEQKIEHSNRETQISGNLLGDSKEI